jgi:serine/threonine protein kinase
MADDPLIGQQLDDYRIEALLGQGGMARVYRGFDIRLERWVAIKVIEASFQQDADYIARFRREARAIGQLEHPHIVSVYRYGEANGVLYMAMRYIEGSAFDRMLATYHQEGDLIPVAEARRIIQQICLALDYAHSRGIIHRDIKPGNIMIDKQGNAYLADFGLALLADVGTRGEIFGTPHYIAPEQAISSAGAVPQSDLYAIGVILYEIFTGQVPFDAESAMDVAMMHMTEPPPPPRQIRPDLSPEVEAVILKALEKEPTDRYPTGAALVETLDQALKARMQVALPLPTSEKSIFQRVAADLAERPLPPMPAGLTPPPPPAVRPEPARPASSPPVANLAAAPPVAPAGVPPRTASDPRRRRSLLLAGLGVGILATGFLVLLLALGFFLFMQSNNTGAPVQATEPAPAGAAITTATATAVVEATSVPAATILPATQEAPPSPTPEIPPAGDGDSEPVATPASAASAPEPPAADTVQPPAADPVRYDLLIASRGEDSMLIINQGDTNFPLAALSLSNNRGEISGGALGSAQLQPGQCITFLKDKGKPKLPDESCNSILNLSLDSRAIFWKDEFDISFAGMRVASCDDDRCAISFQVMEAEPGSPQVVENREEEEKDDD